MDKQIREAMMNQLDSKHREQNIFTRAQKYKQSYKEFKVFMDKVLSNKEQESKFFIGKTKKKDQFFVYLGNYDNSPWNQQIIKQLKKLHRHYLTLFIWNFPYVEELQNLIYKKISLESILFYGCNIGNRIQKIIYSVPKWINTLSIGSDPIGNKGQKKLAQLQLPYLRHLELDNTNCTTDCLTNLRKMNAPFVRLKITRHYRLNCSALATYACLIILYPFPHLFMEPLKYDNQHYIFINIMSKRFTHKPQRSILRLYDRKQQTKSAWIKQMLIPQKVCFMFKNFDNEFTFELIE